MADSTPVMVVPMAAPTTRAAAWSKLMAPACRAASVVAMAAVDDCMTAVMASPMSITAMRAP